MFAKMLLQFTLIIGLFISYSLAQKYSFCSGRKKYTFSSEACPGGVFLKKSMKIDESCYCFGSDLKVVQSCKSSHNHTSSLIGHSVTSCSKPSALDIIKFTVARLLLPLGTKSDPINFEYCPSLPSSCKHLEENEVLKNPGFILDEIPDIFFDLNDNDLGRKIRMSRSLPGIDTTLDDFPQSQENSALKLLKLIESVEETRKKLSHRSLPATGIEDLNFFKIMDKIVEMFKVLASDLVMQDAMTDDIYVIFKAQMALFEYSELQKIDKKIGKKMVNYILEGLSTCQSKQDGSPFNEYTFETIPGCPPTLGRFQNPKRKIFIPVANLTMPKEYLYVPNYEDFILGFLWKAIDAVHAECYGFWMKSFDGTVPYYLFSFLENFFNYSPINKKFYNKDGEGTSQYEPLLETDKPLADRMVDVDILIKAIHSRSRFRGYFHKPRNQNPAPQPVQPTSTTETPVGRKKRNENAGLDLFEIWGGQAYCLQKMDPIQPPGFSNSFPKIEYLCNS